MDVSDVDEAGSGNQPVGHAVPDECAPSTRQVPLSFRACRSDRSPARELLHELNDLLDAQYSGRSAKPGSVTTPDEMTPPRGMFLVGYAGDRAVACGGVRGLGDDIAEIKRMFVVPDARSCGIGRALLVALEDACRELGYRRVRLDAGPAQTHSKSLFARSGYREIAPYNDNHIADYFAEKPLGVSSSCPGGHLVRGRLSRRPAFGRPGRAPGRRWTAGRRRARPRRHG